MTLEWRGRTLVITWLPERDALEYRRYRRTAPLGIYQNCAGLERRLREMGICVAGTGGR